MKKSLVAATLLGLGLVSAPLLAAPPADYRGTPFDLAAYQAAQQAEDGTPRAPYHAFAPALTVWDRANAGGNGWVGPDAASASIRVDDIEGRRVLRARINVPNYRYAAVGWQWGDHGGPAPAAYDALSFSLRITGPNPPQELFVSADAGASAPVSLRAYEPDFADGNWHRITIPLAALKATPGAPRTDLRGVTFSTFVWSPCDCELLVDQVTLDRAIAAVAPAPAPDQVRTVPAPPAIPGRLECAYYDEGGEGVAYHDTTPINTLSAVLNQQPRHQRPHSTRHEWNFRRDEGVDISFTKDWADLNHPNLVDPPVNQLYIGGTEDGEWCNYTVNVQRPGTYRIIAAYGNIAGLKPLRFSLNGAPAAECAVPVVTGSMHTWNKAEIGRITFPQAGPQLLTLHYERGYNLGYFEFVAVD